MATKTETKRMPIIERGSTMLRIPHGNDYVVFIHPSIGPNTYREVGREIFERGQRLPTGDETSSLLHASYCIPESYHEPELEDVRNIMRNRWIPVFNHDLFTENGVYVVQDSGARGLSQKLNPKELEKALKNGKEFSWGGVRVSKDGRVRFAPKGSYSLGTHTPESFAQDGFIIANTSLEGAEKLGEVSSAKDFKYGPRIFGVEVAEGQEPIQRVSAVLGNNSGRLDFSGNYFHDSRGGRSFGVLK